MNRKKKEPNKPKTLKGLNELKKLYMGLEGNAFYFEHDQDNPYDGWQDFERFYNNLILLLTYIKFLKPDKSFEKLLRLEDRSFRIGELRTTIEEAKEKFVKTRIYPDEFAQYAIVEQDIIYDYQKALDTEITNENDDKVLFNKFIKQSIKKLGGYAGIMDRTMVNENGLYQCWVYLKRCFKLKQTKNKPKSADSRAYIFEIINLVYKETSGFYSDYNKFFDQITENITNAYTPFTAFLTDFIKKNKIKTAYSSMSLPLVGIPDQIYTSHLFYNPDHEHFHNDYFLSTMKSGLFRLKMYALNKKNYGGTISLNNFITQKQPNSQSKLKEAIETAGKQHPESLFYKQKYDLAILNENSFESKGFLSYSEAKKQRTRPNIMSDLISHAFKGVKKTGHIFLVINKKNIGGWSRFFYNRYKHKEVDSDWDYSISHIVSLKNTSWIIIKKHQEEQKIKVFDAKSFVKEVVKTNTTNNSLTTDVTAILDHKKLIKEFNNEHSAYTKSVETDNLIKSGFNFNEKRWFMRVYRGKPLSSVAAYYAGQKPKNVKKIKLVDPFSWRKKIYGGLDFDSIQPQIVPPNFEKKEDVRKINKPCLLLNPTTKGLNPVWFGYENKKPIYIRPLTTWALNINEKKALGLFLEIKMQEKTVLDQLSCLESKSRWLGYHFSEIMNSLKIQIPSVEKQKEFIETKKREKIKELEKQIDQIEERSGAELKKDFDFLEHAIKSPVFKITSSTKLLKSFVSNLDKGFSEELKKTFQERYDEKIEDFLAGLISAATEIPKIVNTAKTRAQFSLKQYPNKEYSYKEVVTHIERTVNKIKNKNYNISVKNNLDQKTRDLMYTAWSGFMRKQLFSDRVMDQDLAKYLEMLPGEEFNPEDYENDKVPELTANAILNINLDLLDILIQNLLDNAEKHGELEKTKNGEVVIGFEEEHIELDKDSDGLRIAISIKNNGKQMKKNITKKAFWQKGFTTNKKKGSGYGGAIIKNVCENFNWDFELINDETKNYPVSFIFRAFPKIKLTKKQ